MESPAGWILEGGTLPAPARRLLAVAGATDPQPAFGRLRARDPVHPVWPGVWLLTRYADVSRVLEDQRGFSNRLSGGAGPDEDGEAAHALLYTDPPEHARLRRRVAAGLSARMVGSLRPHIHRLVDELLDPLEGAGSADLGLQLAGPLPLTIICELLGVPRSDRALVASWARDMGPLADPVLPAGRRRAGRRAREEAGAYFGRLLGREGSRAGGDLLSSLIRAVGAGPDGLTEQEAVVTCVFLLIAGHLTTVGLISNAIDALRLRPELLRRLRGAPQLVPAAVEEVLRYESPLQFVFRRATADRVVGGRTVGEGDRLVLALGAANRDPERFAEPDRLDVSRPPKGHLAFGAGPHRCPGATLARTEARVALTAILERVPDLSPDPARSPARIDMISVHGLKSIPVLL